MWMAVTQVQATWIIAHRLVKLVPNYRHILRAQGSQDDDARVARIALLVKDPIVAHVPSAWTW